jgi:hypothetical protein
MEILKLIKTLQKEFGDKVVTAERMADRRFFITNNSLDNKIESGKPIIWNNLKKLSQEGYVTVLYQNNLMQEKGAIKVSVTDETNCFKIKESPNANIQCGPVSFREIYESLSTKYPIVVSD